MEEIHVNDVGTLIVVTIKENNATVDVSSYSDKKFVFKKPNGEKVVKNVDFTSNGQDGKLSYIIESGVLDQCGYYKLQVILSKNNDVKHSNITSFKVFDNLESD